MLRRIVCLLLLALPLLAADLTGTWDVLVETSAGSGSPLFKLQQQGEKLTGSYIGALGEAAVTGTVKGDVVEFSFETEATGSKAKVEYKGTITSPTTMKGTLKLGDLGEGTWTAKKK